MRPNAFVFAATALMPAVSQCEGPSGRSAARAPTAPAPDERAAAPAAEGPIRIEQLEGSAPPIFVMRGSDHGPSRIVFLHGLCGHGLGYAQSFQFSAARKGVLVSPQADKKCGEGPWAAWSGDLEALDERIVSAFRALGLSEPAEDITVVGYSQGATRAEALARRWPVRYSRLVLIAAPDPPNPRGLSLVRSAVMMAGERDRHDLMNAGAAAFKAAGIPSTFQTIPEARHGEMGPRPEETMGKALDWVYGNERAREGS
jgi:predicted esterase